MAIIRQLTSSGVVHPPPGFWELRGIGMVTTEFSDTIEPGVTTHLDTVGGSRVLRDSNWLEIRQDRKTPATGTYICSWMTPSGPVSRSVFLKCHAP